MRQGHFLPFGKNDSSLRGAYRLQVLLFDHVHTLVSSFVCVGGYITDLYPADFDQTWRLQKRAIFL